MLRKFIIPVLVLAFVLLVENSKVPIVSMENVMKPEGQYRYGYESGDGTKTQVIGDVEKEKGRYEYVGDNGKIYSVQYKADEKGFQPTGDHIPKIPGLIQQALNHLATAPPPKNEE